MNKLLLVAVLLSPFLLFGPSCKKQKKSSITVGSIIEKLGGVHKWEGIQQSYYIDSSLMPRLAAPMSLSCIFGITVINDSVIVGSRLGPFDTLRLFTRNNYTNTLVFTRQDSAGLGTYITFNYVSNSVIYDDYTLREPWSVNDFIHCHLFAH